MEKSVYFISDLHLGLESKEKEKLKEEKLIRFLNFIKEDAEELFILGDLFDYWFEYRRVIQKGYFKTFTALKNLTDAGIKVHYLIGNHDFMHRNFFNDELNVAVYEDPIEIELKGKIFFLGHGDGLVKNDLGYKILKKILRNKFLQKVFSLIHPDLGIAIASSSSKKSRDYTAEKNYGEIDGLFETAQNKIDEGFDFVIFGHSHNRADKSYKNGRYVNLGTWLSKPCYLKYKDGQLNFIDWE